MKQTAVELLVEQLENHNGVTRAGFEKCIQEAKEMEKQHLYNFYMQGGVDAIMEADRNVEQYYNETFKSE